MKRNDLAFYPRWLLSKLGESMRLIFNSVAMLATLAFWEK